MALVVLRDLVENLFPCFSGDEAGVFELLFRLREDPSRTVRFQVFFSCIAIAESPFGRTDYRRNRVHRDFFHIPHRTPLRSRHTLSLSHLVLDIIFCSSRRKSSIVRTRPQTRRWFLRVSSSGGSRRRVPAVKGPHQKGELVTP